ncbi:MAG TPA: metal-sensitive transcriptional regulator, partial [Acidobacteriaceae bacterium]|nr:metal-sensitive transcriptional regulator [Acidobacteriaceae bacterium]
PAALEERMKQTKTPQKSAGQKPSAQPDTTVHSDERLAIAVDPDLKTAAVRRLRRIAGQVRGLESMVDQERYCADILVQIASVQEALRGVSRLLMRNHLEHCATMAIRSGGENANAMYDELLDLVYRHAR